MAVAQRVKLMSDCGAGWPLWSARGGLLAADTLPLSTSLAADLRAWQNLLVAATTMAPAALSA